MGCGASSNAENSVLPMEEKPPATSADPKAEVAAQKTASSTSIKATDKPKAIAFEIPVDELKVVSNVPSTASAAPVLKTVDEEKDSEVLKAELKAKEEQAEKNRQKELEKIQAKAAERDEQAKKVAERKKANVENGEDQGEITAGGEHDEKHSTSKLTTSNSKMAASNPKIDKKAPLRGSNAQIDKGSKAKISPKKK